MDQETVEQETTVEDQNVGGDEGSEETVDPYAQLTLEEAIALAKQKEQELAEKKTQIQQKEEFIQSQRSKISQAKEFQQKFEQASLKLQEAQAKLDALKADPNTDIDSYAEAKLEANRHKQVMSQASATLAEFQVTAAIPDFEELLKDSIPKTMKAEGYTDEQVQQFKANWRLDPVLSMSIAKTAKLREDNERLQRELETTKSTKKTVNEQIVNAASLSSGINVSGATTKHVKPVENMSQEEIIEEYNRLMKKGVVTPRK